MYDSTADTNDHIARVRRRIAGIQYRLTLRAIDHDLSKLQEPEKSMYDHWKPILRTLPEGSADIAAAREAMGGALRHHYAHNSHHPEAHADGIAGMSLLDLIEMFADWSAAAEEKGGELMLDAMRQRFGISDQLWAILGNTAKELGW